MEFASTFIAVLQGRVKEQPNEVAFRFLRDGEYESEQLTYNQLDAAARVVAHEMVSAGLAGSRALILLPSGLNYIVAILGCFYAGVVGVPAYPPRNRRNFPRIEAIADDAETAVVLTDQKRADGLRRLAGPLLTGCRWILVDNKDQEVAQQRALPEVSAEEAAYFQYTSGSTGSPKGVIVTHSNLVHNAKRICESFQLEKTSRFVSWLPLFHDLGLIYGVLVPLYAGGDCALMSASAFLQRPYRWLKAISDYRATASGAPNFAYDLCVDRVSEDQKAALDLGSWKIALNGAEPVRHATIETFTTAFSGCGFRRITFKPSYGLAEATLVVSCTPADEPPTSLRVDSQILETEGRAVEATRAAIGERTLVASGVPFPDQLVVAVDPSSGLSVPEGHVGEIWVSGPSRARGYWLRPRETTETFEGQCGSHLDRHFLRTGDLGLFHEGRLYVVGRLKDLIIINGRNLYPQDLEEVAERSHSAVRSAGAAAFFIEQGGQEKVALVAEVAHRCAANLAEVAESIRREVAEEFWISIAVVALIKPGSLPKTSSGKVQRRETRNRLLNGGLETVWSQSMGSPVANGPESEVRLEDTLRAELADLLRIPASSVDPKAPLTLIGLDSLSAAALSHSVKNKFGVSYPVQTFFGDMSLNKLVQALEQDYRTRGAEAGGDFRQSDVGHRNA